MKQWVNFESSVAQFLRLISMELVFLSKTTFSKRISLNVMNPIKNRMPIGIQRILYLSKSGMRESRVREMGLSGLAEWPEI